MATIKKTPAIRFRGFEEEWQEKKSGEIFDCDIPTNTLSRANLSDNQGEIKNIHYGDILIKYNSFLNISENSIPYIMSGNIVDFKNHFLKDGDIIFADAAEDQMVGKSIEICNVSNNYVVAGLHTIATRPLVKFQKYYLGYYLNSNSFHGQLISLMQGTKVLSISKNNLKKALLKYPNTSEQAQIGNYFKELDVLIQLQEQKLERVTNLKKAMLEKMFPKENADFPEIRFKGSTEKWEKKKLEKFVNISSASRVHKNEWTTSGVPFFRSSDVVSAFKGLKNTKAYISNELYLKLSSLSGAVKKDDILITGGGSIGIPYLIKSDNPLYFKDADLLWVKNINNINGYFLYTFFLTQVFRNYIESITHIGTISHYTIEQARSTPIAIPDYSEQQKIGEYFHNLDQLISQSQQKIKQLKNLKQALLQKMFI